MADPIKNPCLPFGEIRGLKEYNPNVILLCRDVVKFEGMILTYLWSQLRNLDH